MRNFFITLILITQFAQAGTSANSNLNPSDSTRLPDIRERLVQLALQNPSYEIADHAALAASYQVRIAKSAYLGLFSAAGNINEFTINPPVSANGTTIPVYYPKYNFAVNIPFDIFTRTTNTVRIAKETMYMANAAKNEKFREIKADVLTKYENYLLAKQLVDFQGKLTQNEYSTLKRAESDFAENLIKLDDLEKAQKNYINQQVQSLTLQKDLNITKIELEKLIGVRIEDVEKGLK